MPLPQHILELTEQHQKLDEEIREELEHPGSDTLHISELKRQKLRLKEEILRLRGQFH